MGPSLNPALVVHADWSVDARKRWMVRAVRGADGAMRVHAPEPVGPLDDLFARLRAAAGGQGAVMLGLDLPFGLPAAYAARARISHFPTALRDFGSGVWAAFYEVAALPDEIRLHRPFYPRAGGVKGAARRRHLLEGMGFAEMTELMRRCDHATASRAAASMLFWTLGGQQVGKAALGAWRDLVAPALRRGEDVAIWPFDGPLETAFRPGRVVLAETYPGEVYGHLGIAFRRARAGQRSGKRVQADRAANAPVLRAALAAVGATAEPGMLALIDGGFGTAADGEDRFDATVGVLGMLNVLCGRRPSGEPRGDPGLAVEGWILGQTAFPARRADPHSRRISFTRTIAFNGDDMADITRIETTQPPGPRMSRVVIHGNTVYVCGLTAGDTKADIKGQTQQILDKIDGYLAQAGTSKARLLHAQLWIKDMAMFQDMNSVWNAWVDPENPPVRACVRADMARPEILVEIMVTAAKA